MKINKRLNARTVRDHLWQIKRFLRTAPKAPAEVTEADVQEFMARFLEAKPRTYRNVLVKTPESVVIEEANGFNCIRCAGLRTQLQSTSSQKFELSLNKLILVFKLILMMQHMFLKI